MSSDIDEMEIMHDKIMADIRDDSAGLTTKPSRWPVKKALLPFAVPYWEKEMTDLLESTKKEGCYRRDVIGGSFITKWPTILFASIGMMKRLYISITYF
jgi:hypothetical protein